MSNPRRISIPSTAPTIAATLMELPVFSPVATFTPLGSPAPEGNVTLPVGTIKTEPLDNVVVEPPDPPLCVPLNVLMPPPGDDPLAVEPVPPDPPFEFEAFPVPEFVLTPLLEEAPFPLEEAPLLLLLLPPLPPFVVSGLEAGVVAAGAGAGVALGAEGFTATLVMFRIRSTNPFCTLTLLGIESLDTCHQMTLVNNCLQRL